MKSVHMICAKCGSDDMHFDIGDREFDGESYHSGVYIICKNCAESTSVEEHNEKNTPK